MGFPKKEEIIEKLLQKELLLETEFRDMIEEALNRYKRDEDIVMSIPFDLNLQILENIVEDLINAGWVVAIQKNEKTKREELKIS